MPRMSKNKKALLNAFGDNYLLLEHDGGYILYDKSKKGRRSNFLYLGKFYTSTDNTKYVFNNVYYSTIHEMIAAMDEYNKTLPYDAELDNPMFVKSYKVECALHDYLESLGFKQSDMHDTYSITDHYGLSILVIRCIVQHDTTKGKIIQFNEGRWTESPFNTFEEAIAAVNSLVALHCTVIDAKFVDILSKLTSSRTTQLVDKKIDYTSLSVITKDAKQRLIEQLEKELNNLRAL